MQPSLLKLVQLSKLPDDVVKAWYDKQPIVQIHRKPPLKSKLFNHFQIDKHTRDSK